MTYSGHFVHEVVTCQPRIRHRSGKVRQSKTDVLTAEPSRQHIIVHEMTVTLSLLELGTIEDILVFKRFLKQAM